MNPDRIIALRSTLTVFRDCDRCLKVFGAEHTQSSVLHEAFNAASAAEGILRSGLPQGQIAVLLAQNAAFPEGDRLLHGTPEMSNVIIDNGGGAHVVGWSRAVKGCPAADVARGYILARRIYGTAAAEEYLELRCRAGDVGAEDAARRIPVAAAAMLHYANEYERKALRALINTD